MTTRAAPSSSVPAAGRPAPPAAPIRAGAAIDRQTFEQVRRRMVLEHCKWDPQVGDVTTLAPFPLILSPRMWRMLATAAEAMSRETIETETRLLERPDLHARLGLPRSLRKVLRGARRERVTPAALRVMRFDFHPTRDGWRVSEVNSDVPGGFTEASAFAALMAEHCDSARPAGDPSRAYVEALARALSGRDGDVVLLSAAGFMEDHQVVASLARLLRQRGVGAHLAQPQHLRWSAGAARLETAWHRGPVAAIVRFYQGEWLAGLPRRTGWHHLFTGGVTPVANPGCAILSESKRLPLVWDALGVAATTWRRYLPQTREPRDVSWRRDADAWVLKTAFCNTGDAVIVRHRTPPRRWLAALLEARLSPRDWVAQRRFDTIAIDTPIGTATAASDMFPCIGVYTIDGRACGAYGRLSPTPIICYSAVDAAVLVESQIDEVQA